MLRTFRKFFSVGMIYSLQSKYLNEFYYIFNKYYSCAANEWVKMIFLWNNNYLWSVGIPTYNDFILIYYITISL